MNPVPPGLRPAQAPALPAPPAAMVPQLAAPSAIVGDDMLLSPAAVFLKQIETRLGAALEQIVTTSVLAGRIQALKDERRNRRRPIEEEWLDSIRRYNGVYSGTVAAILASKPNRSKVFVNITRTKTDAAHADLMDILRGNGEDRPWGLKPIHLPENFPIPPHMAQMGIDRQMIQEEFEKRSRGMVQEIKDLMDLGEYDRNLDLAAHEGVRLGTMCLKGPFTVKNNEPSWSVNFDANLQALASADPPQGFLPICRFVSVFNLYPDMDTASYDPNSSMIESLTKTRRGMMELAKEPGVNAAAVLRCLKEYSAGNYQPEPAMQQLRTLAGDTSPSISNLWEVLCFWGEVTGQELRNAGVQGIPDEMLALSVTADIMVCGKFLLRAKAAVGANPYKMCALFQRGVPGPFGIGIPQRIGNSQDMLNGAMRVIMDNAAIASGPMFEVNTSLLGIEPGMDLADIHGWKVWLSDHDGHSGKKAIQVYDIPAYTQQFMLIVDLARRLIDEESSQPALSGGMQGQGSTRTATGMSILNTNASKTRDTKVRYADDFVTAPIIKGFHDWIMRYSPKHWLLVPCRIIAKGAQALMAREMESQRLIQIYQTAMQTQDKNWKIDELDRRIARSLGQPAEDLLHSPEELAQQAALLGPPPGAPPGAGDQPPAPDQNAPTNPGAPPPMPSPDAGMSPRRIAR